MVVSDKVQMAFLLLSMSTPLSFKLEIKERYSLSELQQLCGMFNSLNPFCPSSNKRWDTSFHCWRVPSVKVRLTYKAIDLLQKVVVILDTSSLQHHNPQKPLLAIILWTPKGLGERCSNLGPYYGYIKHILICAKSPLSLINPSNLALRHKYCHGRKPGKLVFPFSLKNTQSLWEDSISFQEMVAGFTGTIDNHLPKKQDFSMALYTSNKDTAPYSPLLYSHPSSHPGLFRFQ